MDVQKTIRNLKLRGYSVKRFATGKEAADYLAGEISGTTVGIGGCMTAKELGLYDKLSVNNEVFWHWIVPGPETIAKANAAEVYISSANAMTEDGQILNIDGNGNRLAGQASRAQTRSAPTSTARSRAPATSPRRATPCASRPKRRPASSTASATTAAAPTASATRCWCSGPRWAA